MRELFSVTGEGAGVSGSSSDKDLRGYPQTRRLYDQPWVLSTECLSYMWKVWYH